MSLLGDLAKLLMIEERKTMARRMFQATVWTAQCPHGCLPAIDLGQGPPFQVRLHCPHQATAPCESIEAAAEAWNAGEVGSQRDECRRAECREGVRL